jgi:hypothetical protein
MRNFLSSHAFICTAMKTEEQDDLWQLLGRSKAPAASPFFSRNVLRAIREEQQEKPGIFFWLRSHWQVAAMSACAMVVAGGFAFVPQAVRPDPVLVLAQEVSGSPDYQVISNLDELLDTERNSIWLEASIN